MGCGSSSSSAPQDDAIFQGRASVGRAMATQKMDMGADQLKKRGARRRRLSVSAEPVDMAKIAATASRVIPKTDEQKARIREAVKHNFMFKNLDPKQLEVVIDAMERKLFASGDCVIKQGDDGDDFYLLDTGKCDCFVDFKDNKDPKLVKQYEFGESFGELSLMYSTPRAATINATEDCVLWALDRSTFRKVVLGAVYKKRALWEEFLGTVPILEDLIKYEKSMLADCLSEEDHKEGDKIISAGDIEGDKFYFVLEGECSAQSGGVELKRYKRGDYFGELAFLRKKPRACDIVASGEVKLASISKASFDTHMGPAMKRLKEEASNYPTIQNTE